MRSNQLISGLDIGSDKTRLAVAQIETGSDGHKKVNVISLSEVDTEGFTKGNVSNVEDLVSTISSVLEKAEMAVGLPIENVCVGIAGDHIIARMSKGVVAISKANNEIGEDDIERAVETVRSVAVPPNYEKVYGFKFRPYKIRRRRKIPMKQRFIERQTFRLDTAGEVQRIHLEKYLAEQRRRTQQSIIRQQNLNKLFFPQFKQPVRRTKQKNKQQGRYRMPDITGFDKRLKI